MTAEVIKEIIAVTAGLGSYSIIRKISKTFMTFTKNPLTRAAEELGSIVLACAIERRTRAEVDCLWDDMQKAIKQAKDAAEKNRQAANNPEKSS